MASHALFVKVGTAPVDGRDAFALALHQRLQLVFIRHVCPVLSLLRNGVLNRVSPLL